MCHHRVRFRAVRTRSSLPLVIALWLGYIVVWIGTAALLQPDGADFEDAFDDLDNSRYLVYGLIAGVIYGSVVATVFGWWRDVFADDRTTVAPVSGWHRFVPAIALVLILATTDYPGLSDLDTELLAWIIAAGVLVGISEELMFRGNTIVALRGVPVPESTVWLLSSVLFALIHVPNFVLGAPPAAAIVNAVVAFFGGTLFYVVRRASGSILVAMLTHGLWDFTLFAAEEQAYANIRTPVYLILVILIIVTRRRLFPTTGDDATSI